MSEYSTILSWAPAFAFLPICILSFRKMQDDAILFYLLIFATLISGISFYYVWHHHWERSFSSTISATIFGSCLIYILFSLVEPAAKKLTSLISFYMIYLAALAAISNTSGNIGDPIAESSWLILHILFAVLTYALLTLAAITALAVAIKETSLKRRTKSKIADMLPSVYDANHLQFLFMVFAELLLAVDLITGVAVNIIYHDSWFTFDHKTTLTTIAFFGIAVLLYMHRKLGLRGRKASHWILLAYLLVTAGYPGVKFISDVLL
ncbi:cytochrome c biogenesis protein CcsA [Curvivirga aplysinae]|uniref:cytochrome c biogenesis protein CcsA n=1 Tax=Curvivirga aplysinae TaxID=2529852 RepID=UPI0012BD03D9|nr:cytochrome c biogenesis protein CcsA [Curvivirga aplysinae]MTI10068.1 hypothetical protein [Curvivirga aplysinae]